MNRLHFWAAFAVFAGVNFYLSPLGPRWLRLTVLVVCCLCAIGNFRDAQRERRRHHPRNITTEGTEGT